MSALRLASLFNSYMHQQCSAAEKEELMALIADPGNKEMVQELIYDVINSTGDEKIMSDDQSAAVLDYVLHYNEAGGAIPLKRKRLSWISWKRVAAAAVLVFFISGVVYRYGRDKKNELAEKKVESPAVILPGGNRAMLTIADGNVIVLDSMQNGLLSQQGNTDIKKQGASLVYHTAAPVATEEAVFNTLSTPRGGQYQLTLPDGSRVWLNAASSLHFPVAFTGSVRDVELTGEAYFEIAENKEKPFRVKVGGMRVEVLGTHFNVKAYKEEDAIRTSLLEGKVKVVKGGLTDMLQPGQQAILHTASGGYKKINVNMDGVVAWKNGLFQFDGDDITGIMRQIDRWYDVEVVYPDKVPVRRFEGKISRNAQLTDVLHILELSGVKFKVEGKKITVQ